MTQEEENTAVYAIVQLSIHDVVEGNYQKENTLIL
ncbi:hypothetical protein PsAD37_02839 [Pseudovibrio sp. Ad37]|nr:hypothetical protein PsAD37_02839 [Pseudovibrio sp. Ad37]